MGRGRLFEGMIMETKEYWMEKCRMLQAENDILAGELAKANLEIQCEEKRFNELFEQLSASQLHIERLTAALNNLAEKHKFNVASLLPYEVHSLCFKALSQTPSLDALNEERARVLDMVAEGWDGIVADVPGEFIDVGADIRRQAAAYRAKNEG